MNLADLITILRESDSAADIEGRRRLSCVPALALYHIFF